jgi:putative transposase
MTQKQALVQWKQYQSRYQTQQDILRYITMFYNASRLHSYLGYTSPNQHEAEMKKLANVA